VANSVIIAAAAARPLVTALRLGLDTSLGLRKAMKQQQERESTPLWVWLALGLMAIGAVAYLTGYWMFEELIAHFRK
jgi:hypothetical protein